MATDLRQTHFRFGVDELAESTHGWYATEDTNAYLPVDTTFLLRFTEQESGGTAAANTDAQFQYNKNGAGWVDITTSSVIVKAVAAAAFTNGAACTKRLSGTGTFETSGAGCTEDGSSGGPANDIVASGNSETECGLQIVGAQVARGDTIQFRFTSPDWAVTYTVTPTATVLGNLSLVCTGGSFDETGIAAAILHGYLLPSTGGSFAFTGVIADLIYTQGGQAYSLVCDAGAIAFSGINASVLHGSLISSVVGTYQFTGIVATLIHAPYLACDTGAMVLSGVNASILQGRLLSADISLFDITGSETTFLMQYFVFLAAGGIFHVGNNLVAFVSGGKQVFAGGRAARRSRRYMFVPYLRDEDEEQRLAEIQAWQTRINNANIKTDQVMRDKYPIGYASVFPEQRDSLFRKMVSLERANEVRAENKNRQEQIYKQKVKNLRKARKAKAKK
jgi:hypothetical protein